MISQDLQKAELPDVPGVYFFKNSRKEILYVGKATSLKDRVRSYFASDLIRTRGERLVEMVKLADNVEFKTTDSVLEALLLEANEIRAHLPPYNTLGKDDKSFNYVVVTDEDFPRILTLRGREFETLQEVKQYKVKATYGPFPHGGELKAALKIIRKIFPYRDNCIPATEQKDPLHPKACFNAQLGFCPGVCAGWIDKVEYRKQVRRIQTFFEGKKDKLVKSIERDMHNCAREQKFEEAEKLKRMLYALEHIQDIALIKRDIERSEDNSAFRIEAYDIAHLAGKEVVGVMVVVEDGELEKSQYRKFKIKVDKNDDVGNLTEVLTRRLNHPEWPMPNLVVVDGGTAQLNQAKKIMKNIQVVSVVKDSHHKARQILGSQNSTWDKSILLANSEAHRFAITYHRKLRTKGFRI
jgi:excinuclease ABC subunit C